jgi:uroporphyrinogen-III synthase
LYFFLDFGFVYATLVFDDCTVFRRLQQQNAHTKERFRKAIIRYTSDKTKLKILTFLAKSRFRRYDGSLSCVDGTSGVPLRGNVPTRVRRLREGRFDAILLASAGLDRLGLDTSDLVDLGLPLDLIVPAPAQGALALQVRADDEALIRLCRECLHDEPTAIAVAAERSLLVRAGGGCNLPLGCHFERASSSTTWRARAFLGADHPRAGCAPRWATAEGADPEAVLSALHARLDAEGGTGFGPLSGSRIAWTGSGQGRSARVERLSNLGAEIVLERVLEFEELAAPRLPRALAELRAGDALVLTSKQAAHRLAGLNLPEGVRVGAVGPATDSVLRQLGMEAHCVGSEGARELARDLPLERGSHVLFPCAEAALPDLEKELVQRGITVERVPVYRTRSRPEIELALDVDARVFTSPSAFEACLAATGLEVLRATRSLAIGATTARACSRGGLGVETPDGDDPDGLVRLLARDTRSLETTR